MTEDGSTGFEVRRADLEMAPPYHSPLPPPGLKVLQSQSLPELPQLGCLQVSGYALKDKWPCLSMGRELRVQSTAFASCQHQKQDCMCV